MIALDNHSSPFGLITCSDPRFNAAVIEAIDSIVGTRNYDKIIIPGASKKILETPVLVSDIATLTRLHGVKHWHLVDHYDCSYFKLRYGEDREEDHLRDLRAAKKLIETEVPGVTVLMSLTTVEQGKKFKLRLLNSK